MTGHASALLHDGPHTGGGDGVGTEPGSAAPDVTWFKVDDSFYRHRKVRMLGRERVRAQARVAATGLWLLAGDHAADNLMDGFVPWEVVEEWDPNRVLAGRLIASGLWFETSRDGEWGVQFHDWEDSQPTRDQVIQRRKADAERKARWRQSRQESRRDSQRDSWRPSRRESRQESRGESRQESALPDPTRPDPKEEGPNGPSLPRKRGQRLPEGFAVTTEMAAWAREKTPGVDIQAATEAFVDYWRAKPGKDGLKLDWVGTWRNWMRNEQARRPGQLRLANRGEPEDPAVTGRRRVQM